MLRVARSPACSLARSRSLSLYLSLSSSFPPLYLSLSLSLARSRARASALSLSLSLSLILSPSLARSLACSLSLSLSLIHVYCVLVVRAWTYEYGLNQMYVGGFFTGNRPPVFPPRRLHSSYVSRMGFKFLGRLKSLLYDSLHDICGTHDTRASGALYMIHSSIIHLLCVLTAFSR